MKNEHALNIYEENGLYGAKDQNGQIVIIAQYTEMYPFSCGLSLVRNRQNQYAYIDYANNIVIPLIFILGVILSLFVDMPEY